MAERIQDSTSMLHVHGEMTIYRAPELMQEFSAAVRDCPVGAGVCADLSKVTEFDTAGLQILLMARRMASAGGERFEVLDPSDCVAETLMLCNVSDMIGAPPDVESKR